MPHFELDHDVLSEAEEALVSGPDDGAEATLSARGQQSERPSLVLGRGDTARHFPSLFFTGSPASTYGDVASRSQLTSSIACGRPATTGAVIASGRPSTTGARATGFSRGRRAAPMMLAEESWHQPNELAGSTHESFWSRGELASRAATPALPRLMEEPRGSATQALLDELKKQQVEHHERIEALLVKQEQSIIEKLQDMQQPSADRGEKIYDYDMICDTSKSPRSQKHELLKYLSLPGQASDRSKEAEDASSKTRRCDGEQNSDGKATPHWPLDQDDTDKDAEAESARGSPRQSHAAQILKSHREGNVGRQTVRQVQTLQYHMEAISNLKSQVMSKGDRVTADDGHEAMGSLRRLAATLAASRRFEIFICFLILINSVLIGLEADNDMRYPQDDPAVSFRIINVTFIVLFTAEWILRVVVDRCSFFYMYNPKIAWNVFDTLLVFTALFEEVLHLLLSSSPNMSVMRILRTMRIVRGFRIIRVFAFFRDLRIMVAGIVHSLYSLIWAMLLLISMMYLFAVCLLQFAIDEHVLQTSDEPSRASLDDEKYKVLLQYYGSLAKTIYTLYCAIVGGVDWADVADPLMTLSTYLGFLFCFYVAFAVLCVLNIITGVFVENANRTTAQDEEMVMMEQMELRKQWFEEVKELFNAADKDGSGKLDAAEFTVQMQDLRMQSWLRKIGVQVESYSATGLFQLLDFDGDGKLELDEFAMALQQVHGPARSIDLAKINMDTKQIRKDVQRLNELCITFFERDWNRL